MNRNHCIPGSTLVGYGLSLLWFSRLTAHGFTWEIANSCSFLILNLARQSFEMASKLPFGEIKSSLLASSREKTRPRGPVNARWQSSERVQAIKRVTHILCPLQFILWGLTLCTGFSRCLPSRGLLRAVKCLLPVYCVSNCSLGGENISQFT